MKAAILIFALAIAGGFGQAALSVAPRGGEAPAVVLAEAASLLMQPQVRRAVVRAAY